MENWIFCAGKWPEYNQLWLIFNELLYLLLDKVIHQKLDPVDHCLYQSGKQLPYQLLAVDVYPNIVSLRAACILAKEQYDQNGK